MKSKNKRLLPVIVKYMIDFSLLPKGIRIFILNGLEFWRATEKLYEDDRPGD